MCVQLCSSARAGSSKQLDELTAKRVIITTMRGKSNGGQRHMCGIMYSKPQLPCQLRVRRPPEPEARKKLAWGEAKREPQDCPRRDPPLFTATWRVARSPRDASHRDPRMNHPSRAPAGARGGWLLLRREVRWFPMAPPSPPPATFSRVSGSAGAWEPSRLRFSLPCRTKPRF